ncbi:MULTISPECIES: transcriptional repressor LexA [Actinotignum]|uniref:transcriptional repressor LexA n=1 Tax=Actinotignum TaxID=1653174 RepID=UPI00254A4FCD|nr:MULTISPECIES: transcriptional repressor LexA [Actinotignum]MDE1535699.1 transcriptional repressor LexA [Actinotignum schaalii]MDK7271404.1 transcriptional repressor LexA [Actinotignum schaalii]MDY5143611.1 transcriptional repressor LexA [Actinotignum timonense]
MDRPQLTARQAEILDVVINGIVTHRVPPTVREIGEEVGMSSPSSVKYQLDALEEKGYISRNPRRPRMIELTEAGIAHARSSRSDSAWESTLFPVGEPAQSSLESDVPVDISEAINVPVVGKIAAGAPILAEELIEDVFPLPRQLTGTGELFTLKVQGESMIDAAICDGDWVVVRRQPTAENGEIVAAMIDGEATVKVLQRRDGHVTLLPCNPAYSPIPADDSEVLGRVVMVLRTL